MANETLLKMIVNGLHGIAADNETLGEHLNLRALLHGSADLFEGVRFCPPRPPYPSKRASQAHTADLVGRIADNAGLFVVYLGGSAASPELFDGANEADLLRLIIDWGTVQSGAYRAIVQLYGQQPAPPAGLPNPGAASEERLWAEIVAWFEKIAADSDELVAVQDIPASSRLRGRASRRTLASLARTEQGVHRVTLNTLQLAALLPYHLYHAANARPDTAAGRRRVRNPK
jgi:hypothetical protein